MRERVAQRDRAEEAVIVVRRRPARAVAHRIGDRGIVDRRRRRHTAVDRRRVDVRFERRTRLSTGLPGAVELIAQRKRTCTADHGQNFAGRRADRDEGALARADALGLTLRDAPVDGALRRTLHRRVHRGVDLQAAFKRRLRTELRFEQMRDVRGEVRILVRLQAGRTFVNEPQRPRKFRIFLVL